MATLLTRDNFRKLVLERNNGICVIPECLKAAVDAHHILNRNLFHDEDEFGGYFYENGSGLCSIHHLDAEYTLISTSDLYAYCGIQSPRIPNHFDPKLEYDTWGNEITGLYSRARGEMFKDEGCQKALSKAGVLWYFGWGFLSK